VQHLRNKHCCIAGQLACKAFRFSPSCGNVLVCHCLFLQLYNEDINDLLAPENLKLPIHESKENGVYVAGLREDIVVSPEQVLELLREGEANRHIGATKMNEGSSRSHTVFRMVRACFPLQAGLLWQLQSRGCGGSKTAGIAAMSAMSVTRAVKLRIKHLHKRSLLLLFVVSCSYFDRVPGRNKLQSY
jgi:hypothetical protein